MAERPGFFKRLFGARAAPALPAAPEPVLLRAEEETWLEQLVADLGQDRRLDEVGGGGVTDRIERLWQGGHEQLAIEWLEKLVAVPTTPPAVRLALRARAVEKYELRVDLAPALAHLEALTASDPHATRAHFLLGEHHRRRGDEERALRHYEAVMARDVDYPHVRARVERIRLARGHAAPPPGETIAAGEIGGVHAGARYRLVRELGRGSTGVVYLARDTELEREVAVKLLHPHLATARSADALARFFHEARITASLRHPNIVAVLDLDEDARRIVMELASGGTLRDVLRERGARSLRRGLERHTQVLSALSAAHRKGIVHRDLKPGNLMFRRDADLLGVEVMLGDFGIAHLPDARGETGAAAAHARKEAVGTLAYMSPEQRRGDEPTPADDVHAAAIVLYEMLTGRHPWSKDALLVGGRSAGDLALPAEVTDRAPPALTAALQDHLDRLGAPDAAHRQRTDDALAEAQALREQAIGAGVL
jgi:hypothetical protein